MAVVIVLFLTFTNPRMIDKTMVWKNLHLFAPILYLMQFLWMTMVYCQSDWLCWSKSCKTYQSQRNLLFKLNCFIKYLFMVLVNVTSNCIMCLFYLLMLKIGFVLINANILIFRLLLTRLGPSMKPKVLNCKKTRAQNFMNFLMPDFGWGRVPDAGWGWSPMLG